MKRLLRVVALGVLAAVVPNAASAQWVKHVINGGLPSVSPDGQWIAFSALRDTSKLNEVFVIRADGSSEKQVSRDGGNGFPQWMAGGKQLIFESQKGLAMVALDGSAPQPFKTPTGRGFAPSPDNKWLLYSAGQMPNVKLTVSAMDGTNPRELTSGPGMAFNGMWSPDGKRIAYARVDSTRNMQMWVVNADGSGTRQLTTFTDADGHPQWPSWSPDGKWLAVQAGQYSQNRATNSAHIWLVDVATGKGQKLAAHDKPYLDETPSFFPDGKRIAFQSDRTGRMEVWVMNVDGTGAKQVTR